MNTPKYIIPSLLLLWALSMPAQAVASDKKTAEPKVTVSIVVDSTNNGMQCRHTGFSTESLQSEYQQKRNEALAGGGVMLHEEFASHHYAVKVKKNGKINYWGSIFNGNKQAAATMEHDAEDDAKWRQLLRTLAAKIGLSEADMNADGM
ncbi:MAG: hypothetical protein MJZ33_11715 [Paludibacteraceae bacterium]|nr:hypothetical protein [Paludibacteraceae bacterium]